MATSILITHWLFPHFHNPTIPFPVSRSPISHWLFPHFRNSTIPFPVPQSSVIAPLNKLALRSF